MYKEPHALIHSQVSFSFYSKMIIQDLYHFALDDRELKAILPFEQLFIFTFSHFLISSLQGAESCCRLSDCQIISISDILVPLLSPGCSN